MVEGGGWEEGGSVQAAKDELLPEMTPRCDPLLMIFTTSVYLCVLSAPAPAGAAAAVEGG